MSTEKKAISKELETTQLEERLELVQAPQELADITKCENGVCM